MLSSKFIFHAWNYFVVTAMSAGLYDVARSQSSFELFIVCLLC